LRSGSRPFRPLNDAAPGRVVVPGLVVLCFGSDLFYANIDRFGTESRWEIFDDQETQRAAVVASADRNGAGADDGPFAFAIGICLALLLKPGQYIDSEMVSRLMQGTQFAKVHVESDQLHLADRIVALIPSNVGFFALSVSQTESPNFRQTAKRSISRPLRDQGGAS
jgi:hypothetical protein